MRVPSGVSYVLENRTILAAVLPHLLRSLPVRPVRDYPDRLVSLLRSLVEVDDPRVVVLTPGVYNSAYFEHAFLAREMGVDLVEGRDLRELFWMGRYLERADCTVRFLFAQRRLALEVGYLAHSPRAWADLVLAYLGDGTGFEVPEDPDEVVAFAVLSKDAPPSILRCVERAHENARSARASISCETYESVHRLVLLLRQMAGAVDASPEGATLPPLGWSFALQRIGEACRVVSGYLADTVVRDDGWQVLHAGRHLERPCRHSARCDAAR